jgi:hypothetical protein
MNEYNRPKSNTISKFCIPVNYKNKQQEFEILLFDLIILISFIPGLMNKLSFLKPMKTVNLVDQNALQREDDFKQTDIELIQSIVELLNKIYTKL